MIDSPRIGMPTCARLLAFFKAAKTARAIFHSVSSNSGLLSAGRAIAETCVVKGILPSN
jgi:hypothetical protein